MPTETSLLKTIGTFHAAALDVGRRPEALQSLADLFSATDATYEVFQTRPARLIDYQSVGLPSQADMEYLAHHTVGNPRASRLFRKECEPVLCDYMILDERAMERDAFYAKFLPAAGVRYFLSAQIADSRESKGIVSVQRSRRQGHVERRDLDGMRILLPHLRQAHDVSTRLGRAKTTRRSLQRSLDWLGDGVLLVRTGGDVIHSNTAAMIIISQGDGIHLADGAVDFVADGARARFRSALAAIGRLRRGDALAPATVDFLAPRPSGAPGYVVSVRPILGTEAMEGRAEAMVFIRDLAAKDQESNAFRELFGFTPAETALARTLQSGLSLADHARRYAVSLNTVYTHLRRIKDKTGCRRLPELVERLNKVHLPLRHR